MFVRPTGSSWGGREGEWMVFAIEKYDYGIF